MAKPTLQSKAYQMILDKIISGEFQPGAEMREAPLAQALGISVTPIREALRRLEREGWLETFPYRGCFMRRISREELIQLSLMRESLEVVCVEQFCRNGTEQDIELVEENLRNSRRLMERVFAGELDESAAVLEMYQLDKEFHQLIIAGAHRSWLEQELRKWSMQLQTYAALTELRRICWRPLCTRVWICQSLHLIWNWEKVSRRYAPIMKRAADWRRRS